MKRAIAIPLFLVIPVLFFSSIRAQQKSDLSGAIKPASGIGDYNTPFNIIASESIKIVLDRIKDYFCMETPFRVIDVKTKVTITDFTKPVQDADFDNGDHNLFNLWTYEMGVTYSGMLKAAQITGDRTYSEYPEKCFRFYLENLAYFKKVDSSFGGRSNSYRPLLHTKTLDDCGSIGAALIKIYKSDREKRYLGIIDHIADHISNKQFRLHDGLLARESPFKRSIWLDDAYMSVPFLAQIGSLTGNKKYFDDAVKQVLLFSKYLLKHDKRLYDHGRNMDNPNDPEIFWARANGWMVLAVCELLDQLPQNYRGRDEIVENFRIHIQGLTEYQGGSGLWHNVLNRFDSFEETSSSAMFVYGIAHGINMGWLDQSFASVAYSGWNGVSKKINQKGQVEGTCIGTSLEGSEVYYYQRPTSIYAAHGYGPVLLAGSEMLDFIRNQKHMPNK